MKKAAFLIALISMTVKVYSQTGFAPPMEMFSRNKPAYITLKNGQEIEGIIRGVDRKGWLVLGISLKVNDKKVNFEPNEIQCMYLPANGFEKFIQANEVAFNMSKWESKDLSNEILNKGYAYFEAVVVDFGKKKKEEYLLQLVNTTSSKHIKVYHDPFAKETMSANIGFGLSVGGIDKSYYVKKGNNLGIRLYKKNYNEESLNLFSECPQLTDKLRKNAVWSKFDEDIMEYSECIE